jgi:DNA processing protein
MTNFNSKANSEYIKVDLDDEKYPKRIKTVMGSKAPKTLYMLGNSELLNLDGIGFCGSRKASIKGLKVTEDCATQIAERENITVISGNAAGVDFEAHYNSLKSGGKTIFVIPEGINHFRIKKELKNVWDLTRILIISQFEPDEPWKIYRAMMRNQLIIALSRAMIVIEAGETGGTMNTGKQTLKHKLPLFVVQYENMPTNALGNKILIDMGATKLIKNKQTNKASLAKVFAKTQEQEVITKKPQQGSLLGF